MNKRVIVAILVALAVGAGYAAVTVMMSRQKPDQPPIAKEPAMRQNVSPDSAPSGETPAEGKPKPEETKADKPDQLEKPAADAKKPTPDAGQQTSGERPSISRRGGVVQLMLMSLRIPALELDPATALTPAQAKKVLAILTPLRSKPKLTAAEAEKASEALAKVFTAEQTKAMSQGRPDSRPGDRPRPPRDGAVPRPSQGDRPSGTADARPPRSTMENLNPFYTKGLDDDPRARMRVEHMNRFFADLEKKAES